MKIMKPGKNNIGFRLQGRASLMGDCHINRMVVVGTTREPYVVQFPEHQVKTFNRRDNSVICMRWSIFSELHSFERDLCQSKAFGAVKIYHTDNFTMYIFYRLVTFEKLNVLH